MIITKLIGGLGNQMFQYAVGRRLAAKLRSKLSLDISGYEYQPAADTKREYELGIFNIVENIADRRLIRKLKGVRGSFAERVVANRFPKAAKFIFPESRTYYFENVEQKFEERILKIKSDAYLEGWWHSYRYFDNIQEILQREFTLKRDLLSENQEWLKQIQNCQSLGIHVRLGDYISKYGNYFAYCDDEYFNQAIKMVIKKRPVDKIFVFVEERVWPKTHLKTKIPIAVPVSKTSPQNWQDYMFLMKACKHQIIANSSFSWWPAYLNQNPDKIVVAPKKWLQNQKFRLADRIPKKWQTL